MEQTSGSKTQLLDDDVFVVRGLMSAERCRSVIAEAESRGFDEAPITTAGGFVMRKEVRNNTRVMYDDVALAEQLWAMLKPFVPGEYRGWSAVGLNERFRIYRYDPGQHFRWHRDGSFVRHRHERSLLTAMLYLNDDFEGGATEMMEGPANLMGAQPRIDVAPETGMWLLFDHPIVHQGAEVRSGRKYVLRSDVMYRND